MAYPSGLVDTHAHLDDDRFGAEVGDVIRRAVDAGVGQMISVGTDLPSSRAAVALAESYGEVYATVGVHPHGATKLSPAVLDEIHSMAAHPKVVAVGETGLDFYRDLSPKEAQREAFRAQLQLAMHANKPVVVHIRDQKGQNQAHGEALTILRGWAADLPASRRADPSARLGVLHCFSGEEAWARKALALGFCLGVDGPVTFPNAKALQAMVASLPLDAWLLETDCPYLAPQAQRGRRNEPAFLPYIAAKVAELNKVDIQDVAEVTSANARRLFRLPAVAG